MDYFLPRVFTLLRLYDGIPKAVKLDIWAVDEYYLDCEYRSAQSATLSHLSAVYSSESPIGLPLLAAYLFYRSLHLVPALIRG